jgi:hypothetical protein
MLTFILIQTIIYFIYTLPIILHDLREDWDLTYIWYGKKYIHWIYGIDTPVQNYIEIQLFSCFTTFRRTQQDSRDPLTLTLKILCEERVQLQRCHDGTRSRELSSSLFE